MAVRGALATMPAEDILEWAARRRLSAPIAFERHGVVRSLMFEDGTIRYASSNRRAEQLGAILVRSGLVAERALGDALEARSETGVPLGKMLVMSGLLTESDLVAVLVTKIQETVTDLVTWLDGAFDVVPRGHGCTPGVEVAVSVDAALALARPRSTRMTEVMNVLGSDDVTFYAPPGVPSDDNELRLRALAETRHSAAEIAASFAGARYAIFDELVGLVRSGSIIVDRRRRPRTDSAIELAAGARGRLRDGDRIGALELAAEALSRAPNDSDIRATFAQAKRARVAEVAKRMLARHRVPRRTRDASELSGLERELAARVDGRWDLLSLIRGSGAGEAEALLAFDRLADLGVVELE